MYPLLSGLDRFDSFRVRALTCRERSRRGRRSKRSRHRRSTAGCPVPEPWDNYTYTHAYIQKKLSQARPTTASKFYSHFQVRNTYIDTYIKYVHTCMLQHSVPSISLLVVHLPHFDRVRQLGHPAVEPGHSDIR